MLTSPTLRHTAFPGDVRIELSDKWGKLRGGICVSLPLTSCVMSGLLAGRLQPLELVDKVTFSFYLLI